MKILTCTLIAILFASTGLYNYRFSLNPLTFFGLYEPEVTIKINSPEESGFKTIIFDLDGVLFTTSKMIYSKIALHIPLYLIQKLYEMKWDGIENDYIKILTQVKAKSNDKSFHKGKRMPQILIDWQTGTNISETVKSSIQNNKTLSYACKKLMLTITSQTLNPIKFINSRVIIPAGVRLLKNLKAQGYKVYILSNWDAQSFPLLQKKFPEIINLFDGFLISGEAQILKPNKKIFMKLLEKYNLKAEDCVFIDNEQHNVTAAQEEAQIRSVLFDKDNIKPTLSRLQQLNIITYESKNNPSK